MRDGYECGLTLTYSDIKEGDVIETYELVEKERADERCDEHSREAQRAAWRERRA